MKRNNLVFVMLMTAFGEGAAHAQIPGAFVSPDYAALEEQVAFIKAIFPALMQSKGCEYQGKLFPLGFEGNSESGLTGKICTIAQDFEVKNGLRVPLSTYSAQWAMKSLH